MLYIRMQRNNQIRHLSQSCSRCLIQGQDRWDNDNKIFSHSSGDFTIKKMYYGEIGEWVDVKFYNTLPNIGFVEVSGITHAVWAGICAIPYNEDVYKHPNHMFGDWMFLIEGTPINTHHTHGGLGWVVINPKEIVRVENRMPFDIKYYYECQLAGESCSSIEEELLDYYGYYYNSKSEIITK